MAKTDSKNNKKKKNKKNKVDEKQKHNSKIVKNLLLIIFVFTVSLLLYRVYNVYVNGSKIVIESLPLVETQVQSSKDGEAHTIKTNVSFGIDKKLAKQYNESDMEKLVYETIASLDYDKLKEPDGIDYLKDSIEYNVLTQNPYIVNENFDIYISGYDLGLVNGYIPGMITDENSTGKNRNQKIDEAFGN